MKWFNRTKGFGFIECDEHEGNPREDIFLHYSQIKTQEQFRTVKDGDTVQFYLSKTDKGYQAVEVTKVVAAT